MDKMDYDRDALWARSEGMCEACNGLLMPDQWEWHHCYFRSQYKKADMHELWNAACLCHHCHDKIHDGDRTLGDYFRAEADRRKPPHLRAKSVHPSYKEKREKAKLMRGLLKKRIEEKQKVKRCLKCKKPIKKQHGTIGSYHRTCFGMF